MRDTIMDAVHAAAQQANLEKSATNVMRKPLQNSSARPKSLGLGTHLNGCRKRREYRRGYSKQVKPRSKAGTKRWSPY